MIVAAALALLLLGVVIGARGMRRLGASLRGPWRPGATGVGLLALFASLALAAWGELWAAAALGALAVAALGVARYRRARRAPRASGMSRAEAAELLGVGVDAAPSEVEAAFRRLILKLHPDQGGTAGLTARLQEARRAMTGR